MSEKENPINLTSGVLVPLAQAGVTGLLAGVSSACAAAVFHLPVPAGSAGLLAGCAVTLGSWLVFRSEATPPKAPVMRVSTPIAPVQLAPVRTYAKDIPKIDLSLRWNDNHMGVYTRLQVELDQFVTWCEGVSAGQSLGENRWTGRGGTFSKGQLHRMYGELLTMGIIRRKSRAATVGYELTKKGECLAREIVRRYTLPPLPHPDPDVQVSA